MHNTPNTVQGGVLRFQNRCIPGVDNLGYRSSLALPCIAYHVIMPLTNFRKKKKKEESNRDHI